MRLPAARLLIVFGLFRVGLGAGLLLRPDLLARLLGVDSVTARRTGWLARMVGGREVALGVGSLAAARHPEGRPRWLVAQLVADASDAAALLLAARAGVVSPVLASAAAASAGAAVVAEVGALLEGGEG
jgi:hypothetical protein